MAKKKTTRRKLGRPKGSKSKARPEVDKIKPRCTACGSSRRSDYRNTKRSDISGRTPEGVIYTAVVWRTCTCLDCGQVRVERELIFEPN